MEFSCRGSCPNVQMCVYEPTSDRTREFVVRVERKDSSWLHPSVSELSVLCWRGSTNAKPIKSFADVDSLYLPSLVSACFLPSIYPSLLLLPHPIILVFFNPFPLEFPLVCLRVCESWLLRLWVFVCLCVCAHDYWASRLCDVEPTPPNTLSAYYFWFHGCGFELLSSRNEHMKYRFVSA